MPTPWPVGTVFKKVELNVEDRMCPKCGRKMHVCDHRHHRVYSFDGPLHLVMRLVHCPNKNCPCHRRTFSPEAEYSITMPWWLIDWKVFAWIGHRRFARHWSVSQIRKELSDTWRITLADDAVENSIRRYQHMLAARERDPELLAEAYRDVDDIVLSIDGLQPEKGHETLYVVRELRLKRVWFAESLISSSADEVRRLLVQAREWAERLGLSVRLWISDKQDAFRSGIAREFPGVPHRYCSNHFLRDLAKPVLEADRSAKVKMRKKVRGLRAIERDVLEGCRAREADAEKPNGDQGFDGSETGLKKTDAAKVRPSKDEEVVLDYCTVVRGILNSEQGGPKHPPGLRMAESLREVRASIQNNLDAKKGGPAKNASKDSARASTVESTAYKMNS